MWHIVIREKEGKAVIHSKHRTEVAARQSRGEATRNPFWRKYVFRIIQREHLPRAAFPGEQPTIEL